MSQPATLSERNIAPEEIVTAFKGFVIRIEDNSRGSFSDGTSSPVSYAASRMRF